MLGIPMELMSEETQLLLSLKAAQLVQHDQLTCPPSAEVVQSRADIHTRSLAEQTVVYKEERIRQTMQIANKILEGKRKKHKDGEFNEEAALKQELDKIPEMSEEQMMVQIFTSMYSTFITF